MPVSLFEQKSAKGILIARCQPFTWTRHQSRHTRAYTYYLGQPQPLSTRGISKLQAYNCFYFFMLTRLLTHTRDSCIFLPAHSQSQYWYLGMLICSVKIRFLNRLSQESHFYCTALIQQSSVIRTNWSKPLPGCYTHIITTG